MILDIEQLVKRYHQGATEINVLNGVNLQIEQAQTVSIIGPSGSGKSTLLSLMTGLDSPDEGRIIICGTSLGDLDEKAMTQFRAEKMGIVFQQFHLVSTLTSLENVMLPLEIARDEKAKEKAEQVLASVNLSHRLDHYPQALSGGECQRVAIARAFVMEPEILFADEPSGNLDDANGQLVMEQLFAKAKEKNTTMILVTHNQELARRCDRCFKLTQGELVEV